MKEALVKCESAGSDECISSCRHAKPHPIQDINYDDGIPDCTVPGYCVSLGKKCQCKDTQAAQL